MSAECHHAYFINLLRHEILRRSIEHFFRVTDMRIRNIIVEKETTVFGLVIEIVPTFMEKTHM